MINLLKFFLIICYTLVNFYKFFFAVYWSSVESPRTGGAYRLSNRWVRNSPCTNKSLKTVSIRLLILHVGEWVRKSFVKRKYLKVIGQLEFSR